MKNFVYLKIKKQNSEQAAQQIRKFDSSLFQMEALPDILKYAGRDVEPVLMFLESIKIGKMAPEIECDLPLNELLSKAGYDFLIADDLKKQNSLRGFFKKEEELCTFKDFDRFKNYHIIYLIKKGANELNRNDFFLPKREDAYGSSVLSIQILKTGGFIKITNRYNHTVQNPDNTFYSNPDYIIPGLSSALKKHFHVDFRAGKADEPEGYLYLNKRLYKYHLETGNVYYGENFYIKDGVCFPIQKDYQLLVDNFIIDFKENKIIVPHQEDRGLYPEDAFLSFLKQEIEGKTLKIKKEDKKTYAVYLNDDCVIKVRQGHLVYANLKTLIVADYPIFLHHDWIEEIHLNNLKSFSAGSFSFCKNLKVLSLKNALFVPANSIKNLPSLERLNLNQVKKVYQNAIVSLPNLFELLMKNVLEIQSNSLMFLDKVPAFVFYKLKKIGAFVMSKNKNVKKIMAPALQRIGGSAISENPLLTDVCLLSLKRVASKALCSNNSLKLLALAQVETVEKGALSSNENLIFLLMNRLKNIGLNALLFNPNLRYGEFEALESLCHCNCFLKSGKNVYFYMPNLRNGKMNLMAVTRKNVFLSRKKALLNERES